MGIHTSSRMVKLTREGVSIGGRYEVLLCGSLFYFRLPRAVWRDRILKLKAAGYNCVDVYFPWNYHELTDGSLDFTGEKDVTYFLEELKAAGIYVVARPGPYICSEWDGGGLPARILESGMPIRCADERFLSEVKGWYSAILQKIAPFSYAKGGPVILLQLDNELDFFDCPDPKAYISRLYALAKEYAADIPCFCCAGQFDLTRAGAWAEEGVEGTLNCYPDSLDPTFDAELQNYGFRFEKIGKPLLVSETNRDHFLLRRELSCGSKLLGAYNQAAGSNMDHFQAVNNWGSPDSFIMTVYDFGSLVDPAGGYRAEAEESVLFAAFLKVAGQALAGALPAKETVRPAKCAFRTTEGGLRVLSLLGGGSAVCVPAFSEGEEISFTFHGARVEGHVPCGKAPFFLFGLDLTGSGIPAILTQANCEPVFADEKSLVFVCEKAPCVGLNFGDGEVLITENTALHGVEVRFLTREEALEFLTNGNPPKERKYNAEELTSFTAATLPVRRGAEGKGTHFTTLGIREGLAEYAIETEGDLFIEGPCDMLRVTKDGVRGETLFADGRDVIVPSSKDGKFLVEIEKWGHSNFDDSQSPSLRTASKKGALSFGKVKVEKVERTDFRLLDTFGEERIKLGGVMPVRIGVSKWNSTRKPVICSYTVPVTRQSERLIVKATEKVDIAVYLEGKKLGLCDFGTFELTNYIGKGETKALTLVYRKQVWTQDVGDLRILHVEPVSPAHIRVRTGEELCTMAAGTTKVSLPLAVASEAAVSLSLSCKEEGYLKFRGKNVMVTGVAGGRVIGRVLLGWTHAPSLQGGDADLLYFCPVWNGQVCLLVEALGEGAVLEGVELVK